MTKKTETEKATDLDTVTPIGKRVLVKKDDDKTETKGGIALPDSVKIPQWTGRIIELGTGVKREDYADDEYPFKKYDKVLVSPNGAIPVDFEPGSGRDDWFVIPCESIIAVFNRPDLNEDE